MKVSVAQVGPPAVALITVGLCAWPYLLPAAPEEVADADKVPEIAAPLLAPKVGKSPARDPFKAPGEAQPDMLALANLKPPELPSKGAAKPEGKAAEAPRREPAASATAAAPAKAPGPDGDAPRTPGQGAGDDEGPAVSLGALALDATIVQPYRRFAMIDGKTYQEGDVLRVPGVGAARLIRIEHDRVLFLARGKPAMLAFRAATSKPAAGVAAARGGEAGPAKGPGAAMPAGAGAAGDMAAMLLRVIQQQQAAQGAAGDAPGGIAP